MAKNTEEKNPASILTDILKKKKDQHYNFSKTAEEVLITSGSLKLDAAMSGGLPLGSLNRMTGVSGGGKTSMSLAFMRNFLEDKNKDYVKIGVLIKSEGRLSKQMRERSGITFNTNPETIKSGECFVLETNIYEMACETIIDMIEGSAGAKIRYFFVIDSTDALLPYSSISKTLYDAERVAGGAVVASMFLKRVSLPISKYGHGCILISQVRDTVKIDPYSKQPMKLSTASGGNALYHFSDWILEVEKYNSNPNGSDVILKNPNSAYHIAKNPVVGHIAKFVIRKSNLENVGDVIRVPIKHNSVGNAVWLEKEVVETLIDFECIKKLSAWLEIEEVFFEQLKTDVPSVDISPFKKFQGKENFIRFIENNPVLREYLFTFLRKQILATGLLFSDAHSVEEFAEES